MKKISIVLTTIFAILLFTPLTTNASMCLGNIVNRFNEGKDLTMNEIVQLSSCTCSKIPDKNLKDNCEKAQAKLEPKACTVYDDNGKPLKDEDDNVITEPCYSYEFDFATYGANYYSYVKPELDNKAYITGMRALIATVKAILSLIIGLIIFILGFGFLYNLNQMGLHSSNPQMRQECLSRIGDIFATAIFLGLIPAIMNAIVSMIQEIKW